MRKDHAQGASIEAPTSQAGASRGLNVGRPSVQRAAKLLKKGIPKLIALVDRGRLSVSRASALAELGAAEQLKIANTVEPEREARLAYKQKHKSNCAAGGATPSVAQVADELDKILSNTLRNRVRLLLQNCAASGQDRAKLADAIYTAGARLFELACQLQAPDVRQ